MMDREDYERLPPRQAMPRPGITGKPVQEMAETIAVGRVHDANDPSEQALGLLLRRLDGSSISFIFDKDEVDLFIADLVHMRNDLWPTP